MNTVYNAGRSAKTSFAAWGDAFDAWIDTYEAFVYLQKFGNSTLVVLEAERTFRAGFESTN